MTETITVQDMVSRLYEALDRKDQAITGLHRIITELNEQLDVQEKRIQELELKVVNLSE